MVSQQQDFRLARSAASSVAGTTVSPCVACDQDMPFRTCVFCLDGCRSLAVSLHRGHTPRKRVLGSLGPPDGIHLAMRQLGSLGPHDGIHLAMRQLPESKHAFVRGPSLSVGRARDGGESFQLSSGVA